MKFVNETSEIQHCDIKLDNFMTKNDNFLDIRLIDFGFSC